MLQPPRQTAPQSCSPVHLRARHQVTGLQSRHLRVGDLRFPSGLRIDDHLHVDGCAFAACLAGLARFEFRGMNGHRARGQRSLAEKRSINHLPQLASRQLWATGEADWRTSANAGPAATQRGPRPPYASATPNELGEEGLLQSCRKSRFVSEHDFRRRLESPAFACAQEAPGQLTPPSSRHDRAAAGPL